MYIPVLFGTPGVHSASSKDLGGQAGKSKPKVKGKAKPKPSAAKSKAKGKAKPKAKSKNGGKQAKPKAVVKKGKVTKVAQKAKEKEPSEQEEAEEETLESDDEVEETPVIMKRPAAKPQNKKGKGKGAKVAEPDTPAVELPRAKKPPIEAPVIFGLESKQEGSVGPDTAEGSVARPVETPAAEEASVAPSPVETPAAEVSALEAVQPLKRSRTDGQLTQWSPEKYLASSFGGAPLHLWVNKPHILYSFIKTPIHIYEAFLWGMLTSPRNVSNVYT